MSKLKNLKQHQDRWFEINAPVGRDLGYPECCIREFCNQPPELLKYAKPSKDDQRRYKAGCVDGKFTGFIPCIEHAKQILEGKITLASLIKNRRTDCFPPFPLWGK